MTVNIRALSMAIAVLVCSSGTAVAKGIPMTLGQLAKAADEICLCKVLRVDPSSDQDLSQGPRVIVTIVTLDSLKGRLPGVIKLHAYPELSTSWAPVAGQAMFLFLRADSSGYQLANGESSAVLIADDGEVDASFLRDEPTTQLSSRFVANVRRYAGTAKVRPR